jgi:hypothetical protein
MFRFEGPAASLERFRQIEFSNETVSITTYSDKPGVRQ